MLSFFSFSREVLSTLLHSIEAIIPSDKAANFLSSFPCSFPKHLRENRGVFPFPLSLTFFG